MNKAKFISKALAVLMLASSFSFTPASAETVSGISEGFQAKGGEWTTVSNPGNFTLSYEDGFGSKAAGDTAFRIYRDGKTTNSSVTLTKTFDTPVTVPKDGAYRFSMEIARQEFATYIAFQLTGKNAAGDKATTPAMIYGESYRYTLYNIQNVGAPVPVGKWVDITFEQSSDGTVTAYYDGAVISGVKSDSRAVFSEITGMILTIASGKAPMNESIYNTGDVLPTDLLFDNINIETAESVETLPEKTYPMYLNSLNMTFDQINYDSGRTKLNPYNSTVGDNHAYKYNNANVVNAVSYSNQPTDGTVKMSYMTEPGVMGKAANDSAFKFFVNAGTLAEKTSGFIVVEESGFEVDGRPAGISQSGDTAVLSFSCARNGYEYPWVNLFAEKHAGGYLLDDTTLFYLESGSEVCILGRKTGKNFESGKWHKLDFIITANDDNCVIQPYMDGEKLLDEPITATYGSSSTGRPSKFYVRIAADIQGRAGSAVEAQAVYYDDFDWAFYPKGSTLPSFETAPSLASDFNGVTIRNNTIYVDDETVTAEDIKTKLLTGGRTMRITRGSEEITEGILQSGDSVEIATEYGGKLYYYIEMPQKNMIRENTFDKVGYDNDIAENTAVPGWDLNKVGGNYSWQSTYLANDGAGGKSADDNYFVFHAKDLTLDMTNALGSGWHHDPNMNTYPAVDYPQYTYEVSLYSDAEMYGDYIINVFNNATDAATALNFISSNGAVKINILNQKGDTETIKDGLPAGRWYKIAITVYEDGTADYYINGELVREGFNLFPGSVKGIVKRLKMGIFAKRGASNAPVSTLVGLDNIRWYGAKYSDYNSEDIINVSAASSQIQIDEENSRIIISGAAMPKAQLLNAVDTDADIAVYTDNTFAAECGAAVPAGAVLMLTSANGEVYKYFDIVNKNTLPTEFGEISISYTDASATAQVSFTSHKSQNAVLVTAVYNGTKLAGVSIDKAENAVGSTTLAATVPVAEGETVRAYLFEDIASIKPIITAGN